MTEDNKQAFVDDLKSAINGLDNNDLDSFKGTFNDPESTDKLVKVGKIDDNSQYGRMTCVLNRTSRYNGKDYYGVFVHVGFISPAKDDANYDLNGSFNLNGVDYNMYGYKKTGESASGQYEFVSLQFHKKEEKQEEQTNEKNDGIPF
tara:strand:+ start:363 stop:803 length:441 start_codon:yes stop_codon:yes gene_type:complete